VLKTFMNATYLLVPGEKMFNALHNKWKQMEQDRHIYSKEVKRRVIEDGKEIFKKYRIKKVVLFGSVLENRMSVTSDVDILVDPLSAEDFFSFQCSLEEKLNLPVDLHTMNEDRKFVEKILERGEVIYEV
jgi:predicted nucleotidyltransferase